MTMKEKIKRMIDEKEAKLKELRDKVKVSEDVAELRGLSEDIDGVIAELENLKQMYAEADEPAGGEGGAGGEEGARSGNFKPIGGARGGKPDDDAEAEKRAKAFSESGKMTMTNKEARAVLVSSGKIATPTEVGGIVEKHNTVSSIVDMVKITNAAGMGAYKVAYEDADAIAAAQVEGGAYNSSDPTFGFVTIQPETAAVLSYISKQVQKQSPLDYEGKVKASALTALRKRAAAVITTKLLASTINEALPVAAIGADTLRKIALSYGGDENVVGGAVLFLNKADLVAFGDVRGSNEKKAVYEITPDTNNPNTGIIKDGGLSVKYCINSNATAHAAAEAGNKTMFYGNPQAFELALFSDYEVKVSEDFAFDKGLLAIRGDVELGGDVVQKHGFVVVTKQA